MRLLKQKILNLNNQKIYLITINNDNNYSISFYNYGGYIKSILIPYKNKSKREDVLIGYNSFNNWKNDSEYFNCIIGRTSGAEHKTYQTAAWFSLSNEIELDEELFEE